MLKGHYEFLRAIKDLQGDGTDRSPATRDVGKRLLAIYKARGGGYSCHSSPPWHGTSPMADEPRRLGMIDVEVGMATFHHPSQPSPTADEYWLGLTVAGRAALAQLDSAD